MDAQIAAFLENLKQSGASPVWACSPKALRDRPSMMRAFLGEGPALARVEDLAIPGLDGTRISARLYMDRPDVKGAIVYLHGGGWVMGSVEGFHPFTAMLARDTHFAVLSIDYRLAPEHPFPTPLEDARAALRWASLHLENVIGHPLNSLLVMGDSAGANLATVAARLHQAGDAPRKVDGQVLAYPVAGCRLDTASARRFAQGYFLGVADMEWFWAQYVPACADRRDPLVSPVNTRMEDLAQSPPALVVTAEYDPLCDEGQAYARQLRDAGVPVVSLPGAGLIHGFLALHTLSPSANRVYRQIVEWIGGKTNDTRRHSS